MWDRALQCLNRDATKRKTREADACRSQRWLHHLQPEKEDAGESPNGGLTLQWGEKQFLFFLECSHQWSCWHRERGIASDWWAWFQMLKHRAYPLLQWWSEFALFLTTEPLPIDETNPFRARAGCKGQDSTWVNPASRIPQGTASWQPDHHPHTNLRPVAEKSSYRADERGDRDLCFWITTTICNFVTNPTIYSIFHQSTANGSLLLDGLFGTVEEWS